MNQSGSPFARSWAAIQLLRPVNAAIVFLTIAVAGVIADPELTFVMPLTLASLAGALIAGGGNALNDCYDLEIDRINRPERPLPSGRISFAAARALWIGASALGLALSAMLTLWNVLIAAFWILSLIVYSRYLKRSVLAGNLLVGVMTGMAFLFGALVAQRPERALYPGLFAFLINVAREFVKDVEDREGDERNGALTLAVKYGPKGGFLAASLTIILLVVGTLVPYWTHVYDLGYLLIVLVVDVTLVYVVVSLWREGSRSNLKRLSRILKLTMLAGLIAIYVGSSS